jgi:hypothetical protein
MIDPLQLNFGDVVYAVEEKNNTFSKSRITMVDENGIEWHRYDRDRGYSIEELVYCGRVMYIESGDVRFDEDRRDEFHFRYPDGHIHFFYIEDIEENDHWFHDLKEAEKYALTDQN